MKKTAVPINSNTKISFIGAGNMSRAIISGLVATGFEPSNIMASNPSEPKLLSLQNDFGINTSQLNQEAIDFADIVMLAVKPQLMQEVCKDFIVTKPNILFVSIAAGLTVSRLRDFLPKVLHSRPLTSHQNTPLAYTANIVRVMPNTPSAIGLGMSGIYAQDSVSSEHVGMVEAIMQSVGKTLVVKNEDDINTVIAAAGSSPAYFFLIAQAMQKCATDMGLNKQDARLLVEQAMLGSARLMQDNPNLELSELRRQVTSKGGTTAKAVESLQQADIDNMFANAMQAAVARAQQMALDF